MNIYLSYKQSWIEPNILKKELLFIKNSLEKLWHKVFIYYFEEDSSLPADKLNQKFLKNIKKTDLVLAYVNYKEKSEGQLLELGMAYALWKEIKMLVNKSVKDNYFLIYGLWKTIEFEKIENLDFNVIIDDN